MMEKIYTDNTETSDSETSVSSNNDDAFSAATSKSKKKKSGSLSKKPILVIQQALKKLVNDDVQVLGNKSSKEVKTSGMDIFCIEDTFLTKNLKVHIEGIGDISFPLEKDSVEQMIKLSSKAKFGKGRETVLDTKVRDTQTIPASKMKIEIDKSSLNELLKRFVSGLNVGKNCQLVPHLHNLLIYGPGQFFKKHTDSEKVENMIATLVIILPYPHEGGELIIEHNKKKHLFFGSKNPDIVKCVAFYSDCAHEIKKVTEGYRVAITYNIVLQSPENPEIAEISEPLDTAIGNYFKSGENRLVFGLNHSYSQKNLKWNLLKGADRLRVNALLAVAKKQGRIPCLALTTYHEVYDKENTYYCPLESPELIEKETEIDYMVDMNNTELEFSPEDKYVDDDKESCCTIKAKMLFKPYETDASGPTGNEGDTEEYWYRRACFVLWSNKWVYTHGFKEALSELHQLTKEDGMQEVLIKKIDQVRKDIAQPKKWEEPNNAEMLLDIVIYLNNEDEAKFILGDLCKYIISEDHINRLVQLEKMFSNQMWSDIITVWKNKGYRGGWNSVVDNACKFVDKYMEVVGSQFKSVVVDAIVEEGVRKFIESEEHRGVSKYVYDRKRKESIESLAMFMKICSMLGYNSLQESLVNHIVGSSYPAVSLGELVAKLMDDLKPEHLMLYETIRDMALDHISTRLSDLKNETGWVFPIKVPCTCKTCTPVLLFFSSKTSNKSDPIECTKKAYDHLSDIFYYNMYSLPFKMTHNKIGRKHCVNFEKLPKLLEDRKKLNDDLVKLKDKIKCVKQPLTVKIENEFEFDSDLPTDCSMIEITENFKTELAAENVNTEPEGGICSIVESFSPLEQVNIKSEIKQEDGNSNCDEEKIPNKRRKGPKQNF